MRDYGLWMTDMAMFKNDASATIQLRLLKPTEYTQMVYDALMLEKLSDEDIKEPLIVLHYLIKVNLQKVSLRRIMRIIQVSIMMRQIKV